MSLTRLTNTVHYLSSSGGLEILFSNQKHHALSVPAQDAQGQPANVGFLINYLCQTLMTDPRADLFVLGGEL